MTFKQSLTAYRKASRAYNSDCNLRFIPRPDAKRKRLAKAERTTFERMMNEFGKLINNL